MQKTAKRDSHLVAPLQQLGAYTAQQAVGISPHITSDGTFDISYSPSITWQDTTSAATYTSAASVLNS